MKNMKFKAGAFIEIDDLAGGRKIVMTCKDEMTYWDTLNVEESTPIVIHECMNPVSVGTLSEFIKNAGMQKIIVSVLEKLKAKIGQRVESDPLFLMRVIWHLSKIKTDTGGGDVDQELFLTAFEMAEKQQNDAIRTQKHIEKYYATQS